MLNIKLMMSIGSLIEEYGAEQVKSMVGIILEEDSDQSANKSSIDEIMSEQNEEKQLTKSQRNERIVDRFTELVSAGAIRNSACVEIATEFGVCQNTVINVLKANNKWDNPNKEVQKQETENDNEE